MSASRPALTSLVDSFDLIPQARVSIAVAKLFCLALHPANFKFILEIRSSLIVWSRRSRSKNAAVPDQHLWDFGRSFKVELT